MGKSKNKLSTIAIGKETKKTQKKKSIEDCTVDEYLDYLEKFCRFCDN